MKNIQEYFKPKTIAEAIRLLREHPGKGKFIAGGTNVVVDKDPSLDYLIDLHHLGLDYLKEEDACIRIGACTTIQQLYQSPLVRTFASGLLVQVASWFASRQIRNVATIGGNIAEGLSAADTAPALLAMDAQVVIVGETEHTIPMSEFFRKEGGNILQDELIKEFILPKIFQGATGKFLKNAKTREDIAIVSVTTTVLMRDTRCEKVRIALGAVAPTPIHVPQAENILEGQVPTRDLIVQAADTVVENIRPIDNFRATAEFRKHISRVYTIRALCECLNIPFRQD
jgi:probable selenate reductase FAD-binding subunit